MEDSAFELLVAQNQEKLLRTCYLYLRDRQLAEDAVQETFLKAYRSLPAFRGDSSEKTWLMRIAVNTCRDLYRSEWLGSSYSRPDPHASRSGCCADNPTIAISVTS